MLLEPAHDVKRETIAIRVLMGIGGHEYSIYTNDLVFPLRDGLQRRRLQDVSAQILR